MTSKDKVKSTVSNRDVLKQYNKLLEIDMKGHGKKLKKLMEFKKSQLVYLTSIETGKQELQGQLCGFYNVGMKDVFTREEGSKYFETQLDDLVKGVKQYLEMLDKEITKEVKIMEKRDVHMLDVET